MLLGSANTTSPRYCLDTLPERPCERSVDFYPRKTCSDHIIHYRPFTRVLMSATTTCACTTTYDSTCLGVMNATAALPISFGGSKLGNKKAGYEDTTPRADTGKGIVMIMSRVEKGCI